MPDSIRVVIVEDQRRTREGLAALIGGSAGLEVAGQYRSGEEALSDIEEKMPGVILTDLGLPGMSGTELVGHLRGLLPGVPILVLTVHGEDQPIFDALCAGACGYLLKDVEPARLLAAIREVHGGGAPMSPEIARRVLAMFQKLASPKAGESGLSMRELEVLNLLAEGDSYKTCADRLAVSIDTIRFHVRRIYERLHVHSRSEAVSKAMRRGWIR
ncbi:MAG TPA: response regulator transcription factor [Verrucomicrobiae bacterium]|nr:response regulator transcription factor [Verrucomicrobiae bacterium]